MKILVDFHHSSLLRSLIYLFEDRLGIEVYRPIGMEWFQQGFWKINNQEDTAKQFLGFDGTWVGTDGTPKLNTMAVVNPRDHGVHYAYDGGTDYLINRACTLDYFKDHEFDYILSSVPAHIEPFTKLLNYQSQRCEHIVQIGNEWPENLFWSRNVLASIKPRDIPTANAMFYHQECDLSIFYPNFEPRLEKKIYNFTNVLHEKPEDFKLWENLKKLMPNWEFRSFGGQNPDGNIDGPRALADKMREAAYIFQCKTGGDGFGHILWNAAWTGTPLISRLSDYQGKLGEALIDNRTSILVDGKYTDEIAYQIAHRWDRDQPRSSFTIRDMAAFDCNFEREAEDVGSWLESLRTK